ncbi:c-type cytochrome [Microbacteriaceae bacterium K1510]|nr:c-type cytochrome [Microbacteriaceae bacterium K1510]
MRVIIGVIMVVAVAFAAFYAWAYQSEMPPERSSAARFDPGAIAKGAQLAAAGNCAACHTQAGGKPYAGGFPVETPFGVVYGSNITPDPETGIGAWPEAAFRRAMRAGIDRKGNHLFPAFPYDHFTKITDNDISALYAFLMTRELVRQENRPPALVGPLNWRLSAAAWKLLFLHQGPYQPDPAQSAEWNRGAYLVEGLGHCGACHTPRNILGAEKASEAYDGGVGEGWHAPALDIASPAPVPWTAEQLEAYLRDGFASQHGYAAGPMQPVVRALRKLPDEDVRAIAVYIASLSRNADETQSAQRTRAALDFAQQREAKLGASASTTTGAHSDGSAESDASSGAAIFAGACATCHHAGGALPISRPVALGLSSTVHATNPTNLLHIILDGIHPPFGARGPIMPGFAGTLTDPQIVALASYVRSHFSDKPAWAGVDTTLSALRQKPQTRAEAP